jgi:hypothetical protein
VTRWKRVIGDGLRSQTDGRQAAEGAIAAEVLNRMLDLGRPEYVRIACCVRAFGRDASNALTDATRSHLRRRGGLAAPGSLLATRSPVHQEISTASSEMSCRRHPSGSGCSDAEPRAGSRAAPRRSFRARQLQGCRGGHATAATQPTADLPTQARREEADISALLRGDTLALRQHPEVA